MIDTEELARRNRLYQQLKGRIGLLPVGQELPCYFDHNGECLVCHESAWPGNCPFKAGNKLSVEVYK